MRQRVYECTTCGDYAIPEEALQVMYAHERNRESAESYDEGAFELLKVCPSGKHVLERGSDD